MPAPSLCTEDEIRTLVHTFYARVRADPQLGPIFNHHVDDWDVHLRKLCDFWSSILLRTARFSGAPMPMHARLPDLKADLFVHWLALFQRTADEQPNQAMAQRATMAAQRIARSLWFGYQSINTPDQMPSDLPMPAES